MPEVLRKVGRYEILREIGRGGMAVVYLARQMDLERDVALKELAAFHASDVSFAQRFVRESRVAGSLSHPNVVTVHDYFEDDGVPFIAMEYVRRGSLRPHVPTLTLAEVAGVLEGVLAGLAHAASRGIVHRDLKPENLMVTDEGSIKIADFGIAKAFNTATARLTATGTTIGTPAYMSPEQVMGGVVGPRGDLYSMGIIAFELLTGDVPFRDEEPVAILLRHVNDPVPDVRSRRPDVDPKLAEWVSWLLAKSADDRPASAVEAWDALEEVVIGILGPRWRRESRLGTNGGPRAPLADTPSPAPFSADGAAAIPPADAPLARETAAENTEPAAADATVPAPPPTSPARRPPALRPTLVPTPPESVPVTVDGVREPPAIEPAGAVSPASDASPRRTRVRRRWLLVAFPAVAAIAGVIAAAVVLTGGETRPSAPPPPPDPEPRAADRFALTVSSGGPVYASAPGGTIVELSGKTLERRASFANAARPTALALVGTAVAPGGVLYVADSQNVSAVRGGTLAALGAVAFPGATAIAGDARSATLAAVRPARGGRLCQISIAAAGASTRCVRLGFVPSGVGVSGPSKIYVADRAAGRIVEYARRGNKLVATRRIRLGRGTQPRGRLVAEGGTLYAPIKRGIAVVDLARARVSRIALRTTPAAIAAARGRTLVAALYASDAVAIVDPRTRVTRLVRGVKRPVAVATDATGRLAYVVSSGTATVTAMDVATRRPRAGVAPARLDRRAAPPVRITGTAITPGARSVTVRVKTGGGALDARNLRVRDGEIRDGQAAVAVLRGGLTLATAAQRPQGRGGVAVRLRRIPGGAVVVLSADPAAFVNLGRPILRSGGLELTLTKRPPPPETPRRDPPASGGGTTGGGTTGGGTTGGGSTGGGTVIIR